MIDLLPGSAEADVDYLDTLRGPDELGRVRREALYLTAVPVVLWLLVPYLPGAAETPAVWALALPALVGAVVHTMGSGVVEQVVRPLPAGTSEAEAGALSLRTLRTATAVNLAVSGLPILVGLLLVLTGSGVLAYAVGFVTGWPQMLRARPTRERIEETRSLLEAGGVDSRLWPALAARPTRQR